MIKRFINQGSFRFLRAYLRGYRISKSGGNSELLRDVSHEFLNCPMQQTEKVLFESDPWLSEEFDRCFKRLYFAHFDANRLNRIILSKIGSSESVPLIYGLPRSWISVLEHKGFLINHFFSSLLFYRNLFLFGIKNFIKTLVVLIDISRPKKLDFSNYILIVDAPHNTSKRFVDFWLDIESFFGKKDYRMVFQIRNHNQEQIKNLDSAGCPVVNKIYDPFASDVTLFPVVREILKYQFSSTSCTEFLVRFFMIDQYFLLKIFQKVPVEKLADIYLFSNSYWYAKPLWASYIDNIGKKAALYFYSYNNLPFLKHDGSSSYKPHFGYELSPWRFFLACDEVQKIFLLSNSSSECPEIDVVGAVPVGASKSYSTGCDKFSGSPIKQIMVFDVSPRRWLEYCHLGVVPEIYTGPTLIRFLSDIADLSMSVDARFVIKNKRQIDGNFHKGYRNKIRDFVLSEKIYVIDSSIDAEDLIRRSSGVISIPFTTPAFLAKNLGVPSVFYDPLDIVSVDDISLRGIEIIKDKNGLKQWLGLLP